MTLGSLSRCIAGAGLVLVLAGPAAAQTNAPTSANTNSSAPAAASTQAATAPAPAAGKAPAPAAGAKTPDKVPARPQGPTVRPSGVRNQLNPVTIPAIPGGGIQIQGLPGGTVPWSIVILLTGSDADSFDLLCITPFARLLIVFHFLRQALGLQTTPSNQTLIGLSLILTFFLMQPVGMQIYQRRDRPHAGRARSPPWKRCNAARCRCASSWSTTCAKKTSRSFVELAKEPRPASIDDVSMRVLLPAYILSELKAGFQIGTVLFLPFLIVDMVVASITTSVGMLQLPPVVISTPLKLLLFLMVDGWHLLIGSLMRSFS